MCMQTLAKHTRKHANYFRLFMIFSFVYDETADDICNVHLRKINSYKSLFKKKRMQLGDMQFEYRILCSKNYRQKAYAIRAIRFVFLLSILKFLNFKMPFKMPILTSFILMMQ